MLDAKEKRFLRYWEEQRAGGKWSFFLLYILLGTFICSLMIFVVLLFFLQLGLKHYMLWAVPAAGLLTAVLLTLGGWRKNEKKWKAIIRREVSSGMEQGRTEDNA